MPTRWAITTIRAFATAVTSSRTRRDASASRGRFRLETIVPAEYPGRARHIHVKVQAPGKRLLTTQLYFPNDPGNARDGLYRRDLEIRDFRIGEGKFDFVVEA